jgi:hypothetical protein
MTWELCNIAPKHGIIMDAIWGMDTREQVSQFVSSLALEDQVFIRYLIGVIQTGGDDVAVEQQTRDLLDTIANQ